ncbi:MAG: hypothetical protein GC150_02105 [Rhizobiales bacterium]|nr:hypothetical protein [Hyphomicrobiales bacterium]
MLPLAITLHPGTWINRSFRVPSYTIHNLRLWNVAMPGTLRKHHAAMAVATFMAAALVVQAHVGAPDMRMREAPGSTIERSPSQPVAVWQPADDFLDDLLPPEARTAAARHEEIADEPCGDHFRKPTFARYTLKSLTDFNSCTALPGFLVVVRGGDEARPRTIEVAAESPLPKVTGRGAEVAPGPSPDRPTLHPREYFHDVLGVVIPDDHGRMNVLAVFSREAEVSVINAQLPVALDVHVPTPTLIRANGRDTLPVDRAEVRLASGIVGVVRPEVRIAATDGDPVETASTQGHLTPTAAIADEPSVELPEQAPTARPTVSPAPTRAKKPEAPARTRQAQKPAVQRGANRPAARPAQAAPATTGGSGRVKWYMQPFGKQ